MTVWFHTTILATSLAATIAIGIASAAKYDGATTVAPKADMLPVTSTTTPAPGYVTVEERGDGVSVLARVPADTAVE